LATAACFPKPLDMQLNDSATGAPVDGVALHKHSISLLTLLPGKQQPVLSQPNGHARVWVPPFNTNITLLRPGYEPTSVAIYKTEMPVTMRSDATRPRLRFEDLKEGEVVSMQLKPVTRTPMTVHVVDATTGVSVPDVEILSSTFLYLPTPGVEDGWGFPDLQMIRTNDDGDATIECISGFRNRVTVRGAGRADAHADVRDQTATSLTLKSRELKWKAMRFEVLDEKQGTPVEGAWVALEEPRHGLPPDPNGFAAITGANGLTAMMKIPDFMPLVLQIHAPGHRSRRETLDWSVISDNDIRSVWIHKKGWFE